MIKNIHANKSSLLAKSLEELRKIIVPPNVYIKSQANKLGYVSISQMLEINNVSERTIRDKIKSLKRKNLIKSIKVKEKNGYASYYKLS